MYNPGTNLVYGEGETLSRCKVLTNDKVIVTQGVDIGKVMPIQVWAASLGATLHDPPVKDASTVEGTSSQADCSNCTYAPECLYVKARRPSYTEVSEEIYCIKKDDTVRITYDSE